MIDKIYEIFNIKENARLKVRIPLKNLYEEVSLNTAKKDKLSSSINGVYLVAELNEKNSTLTKFKNEDYNYSAIQFIYIKLIDTINVIFVDELLHSTLPNPIIIIYQLNEDLMISTSLKRLNKVDSSKTVIDNIYNSNIIDERFANLFNKNYNHKIKTMFDYYSLIDDIVYRFAIRSNIDIIDSEVNIKELKILINKQSEIKKEVAILEQQMSKEKNQSKKMGIFMKIKELEEKYKAIKIKEEL